MSALDPLEAAEEAAPKGIPSGLLRRLLRYARPYRRYMAVSLSLMAVMALVVNYLPVLMQRAIDDWLVAPGLATEARFDGLWRLGGWYLGCAAAGFLLRYGESLLTAWIGQRIVYDLRADVFGKVLRLPLAHFDRTPVGRLMTRVTSDVDAVQRFVTEGVVGSLAEAFMLVGVLGFMTYINLRLTVTLLVLLPPLFVMLTWVNLRLRAANRSIRSRQSALNALVQENVSGMTTLQLFGREPYAQGRFAERNEALRAGFFSEVHWSGFYFPLLEVAQAVSILAVLAVGGHAVLTHAGGVTLGSLVAFLTYVRDFFRPLGALSDKASSLQQAMAASERLFTLLDTEETVTDPAVPRDLPRAVGRVDFEGVWFAYDAENWVLKDVSFTIRPGESVAVVGATGAGKSTLIGLIGRMYDVQRGAVRVDGLDVREVSKEALRRRLGVVQQEPFIFSGTVADNISLHDSGIGRARIEEAARYVKASRFIERLPGSYEAVLGERGGSLSAGEKQLLSMARVFARDPEIMLMLDEATANVDTETERLIQEAAARLMKGRTSLIIAHRLSTIRHVDRILVMRHGQLVAQGSHDELMAGNEYYRHLYELLSHRPV